MNKKKMIRAEFKDGRSVVYTIAVLEDLMTDHDVAYVVDEDTGEVLYLAEEKG